jgi:hypothetical protein
MPLVMFSSRRIGDVAPLRVLRQPPPERVVDRQAALRLGLEQQHRGEGLGVAADLPDAVRAHRLDAVEHHGPGADLEARPAIGQAHA